ncbi:LysR family transcriptional regulator [Photorhabdus bodei]|uniref:LysR family transcriptional regulator n=2 Tax=Photorhabdus bodei TaxID=2029681 RepID=A0ABX0AU69_9GAMM|nr:LysR family transcriptional regulator [Photorhabdus bodei]NDL04140.1 LysR family transcriptional regulator [Photorhabdus bodei]NDL08190.1 LysR family transcriptional regulator [Photorhabdus bodei]
MMLFCSKHLKYFMESAKRESFTLAADTLCITPSPLSRIIYQLEQRVGCQLFERLPGRTKLTDEGMALYQELLPCYERIQRVEDNWHYRRNGRLVNAGKLIIGTSGEYINKISAVIKRAVQRYHYRDIYIKNNFLVDDSARKEAIFSSLMKEDITVYVTTEHYPDNDDIVRIDGTYQILRLAIANDILAAESHADDIIYTLPLAQHNSAFLKQYDNFISLSCLPEYQNLTLLTVPDFTHRLDLVRSGIAISLMTPNEVLCSADIDKGIAFLNFKSYPTPLVKYCAYTLRHKYKEPLNLLISDLII